MPDATGKGTVQCKNALLKGCSAGVCTALQKSTSLHILTVGGHRCTTATASAVCHLLGAFSSFASTTDSICATLLAKLLL